MQPPTMPAIRCQQERLERAERCERLADYQLTWCGPRPGFKSTRRLVASLCTRHAHAALDAFGDADEHQRIEHPRLVERAVSVRSAIAFGDWPAVRS